MVKSCAQYLHILFVLIRVLYVYIFIIFYLHCIVCVVVEGKAIASTKALKVRVDMEYQSYTTPPAADKNKPVWGEEYVLYVQIRKFFLFPLMYFFLFQRRDQIICHPESNRQVSGLSIYSFLCSSCRT